MAERENVVPLNRNNAPDEDITSDGRRRRGERSRRRIADALLRLIRAGEVMPSAAQVAEEAGVSLRTVFRHFEDFESLNREMAAQIEPAVLERLVRPFESTTWRGRLSELIDNRAEIYDEVMPIKIAAGVRRFRSKFLMDDHVHFLKFEHAAIRGVLPDAVTSDPKRLNAILAVTSFQNWLQLRQDQGLSAQAAKEVVRLSVNALLSGA